MEQVKGVLVDASGYAPDGWVDVERDDCPDEEGVDALEDDLAAVFAICRAIPGGCPVGRFAVGIETLVIYDVDGEQRSAAEWANQEWMDPQEVVDRLDELPAVRAACPAWVWCVPRWAAEKAGLL